jgi:rhomboid protease GluP
MSTDRPIAVYVLVGINVLVYLISLGLTYAAGRAGTLGTPDGLVLRALGWKENHLIAAGQYWRLITATFLHGSTVHILFNGYALWALGPETERIYGSGRFLALYFLSGLAGSIASYALSSANSVGASGAIFGLFGALLAFYYVNRGLLGGLAQGQIQSMGSVIVFNLIIGFVVPGVDYYAHLGGLAAGTLSGWMLAPRFSVNRMRYPPAVERTTWLPGWAGAAGLALLLVALALIIVPPLPL